jgi:hypothetical protein
MLIFCGLNCTFSKSLNNLPVNLMSLLIGPSLNNYGNLDNIPNNINCLGISNLKNITKFPEKIKKLILFSFKECQNIINIKNYDNIEELEIKSFDTDIIDVLFIVENIKIITILFSYNSSNYDKVILLLKEKNNKMNNIFDIKIINKFGIILNKI